MQSGGTPTLNATTGSVVNVLLVADVRLHAEGLAAMLERDGNELRATVCGIEDAACRAENADVVVLDVEAAEVMPTLAACAYRPVVAIGVSDDEQHVVALAEAGVLGFAGRDAGVDELIMSIENAIRGEATCPPRIATTLLRRVTHLARLGPVDASPLTARERQIVKLIGEALSNKEIAARLSIEVATVKNHVHNILEKLQVSRRGDAVARLRLVEGGLGATGPRPGPARNGSADPLRRVPLA